MLVVPPPGTPRPVVPSGPALPRPQLLPRLRHGPAAPGTGPAWPAAEPVAFRDGTYRSATPEQTWDRIQPALRAAGVTRVADLTGLDDLGIPTAQAVRPASLTLSVSQGKAATWAAARVSAAMESLEGWMCEQVSADLTDVSAADLAGELSYDPADLDRPAAGLYHDRARLDWVEATTLVTGRRTWLPLRVVLLNVAVGDRWAPPMFTATTNGLASGNNLDEAAVHALYELLERDCQVDRGQGSPVVDPATVLDPVCSGLLARIEAAGSQLVVADISRHPGLPCFTAQLRWARTRAVFGGSGLHRDPAVAIARAVTEAAQSRLTAISGAREDMSRETYRVMRPGPPAPLPPLPTYGADARDHVSTATDDLRADLVATARYVTALTGVEPVATVLRRAAAPGADGPPAVPVVRVLAPGLRFDEGHGHRSPLLAGMAAV